MSNYGEMLISKIIDNNDYQAFIRYGVDKDHFITPSEKSVYNYIMEYGETNRNQTPSLSMIMSNFQFNYIPNVQDSYEYIVKELKAYSAKSQVANMLQTKATEMFDKANGFEFIEWAIEEMTKIKDQTSVRGKVGTDIKKDTEKYLAEYKRRKEGKSFRMWQSHFPTINKIVGGYTSGNMFAFFGRSGRGKSVFALEEAIEAAQQGANVLYYALEMPSYEIMTRIFSSLSAREGIYFENITLAEADEGGFEQRALLQGKLSDEYEQAFEHFLTNMNQHLKGNIIIRAIDDETLTRIDVNAMEQDILTLKPDFIVMDPIYLMDFERNESMVAGGDIANTSKKLRRLCGKHNIVLLVITQAEEDKNQQKDDNEVRKLKTPSRSEMKKSKAILEDSAIVIALDSGDGRAILEIQKARAGGEGVIDVQYNPSYGLVRELLPESSSHFEHIMEV